MALPRFAYALIVAVLLSRHPDEHARQRLRKEDGLDALLAAEAIDRAPPSLPLIQSDWLTQRESLIRRLAEIIRTEHRWEDLPILADALEDVGCAETDLLTHLRAGEPHHDRCWVIDLLLRQPCG